MINGKIVKRADVSKMFFDATAVELDLPIVIACDRKIGNLKKEHRHTTRLLVFSRGPVGGDVENAIFPICSADHGAHAQGEFAIRVGAKTIREAMADIGVSIDASPKVR